MTEPNTRPLKRKLAHVENSWRRDDAVRRFRERIARATPDDDIAAFRARLHIVEQEAQARVAVEVKRLREEIEALEKR
jgi:hypothetical protein